MEVTEERLTRESAAARTTPSPPACCQPWWFSPTCTSWYPSASWAWSTAWLDGHCGSVHKAAVETRVTGTLSKCWVSNTHTPHHTPWGTYFTVTRSHRNNCVNRNQFHLNICNKHFYNWQTVVAGSYSPGWGYRHWKLLQTYYQQCCLTWYTTLWLQI